MKKVHFLGLAAGIALSVLRDASQQMFFPQSGIQG